MKVGTLVVVAMSVAMSAGLASGQSDPIQREGSGQHRAVCDKLELKAAPADLWSTLTDWSNGAPLTAESTKGKVVLIGTWSSFYKTTHAAVTLMQQLSDKYGKDGLVVVAVHHDKGWDDSKSTMDSLKSKVLYAHDVGNKFRDKLNVDGDPDFYVIDRAGNMRYADIQTSSVEKAVELTVKETVDSAAALPKQLADAAAKAAKDADKARTIASDLKPGEVLNVPFAMPEADEYKSAKWPEQNKTVEYATNVQGSALPVAFSVQKWLTKQPNQAGRVTILDFWATWCGPCKKAMPMLDELFKESRRDLVIIGISDEPEAKVSDFLNEHKHAYFQAVDEGRTVYKSLNISAIPHCVVISSDGIVRWQGNPHDENFRKSVMAAIENDPGVKARRKAEADYLKAKGG